MNNEKWREIFLSANSVKQKTSKANKAGVYKQDLTVKANFHI
jgi:hypothetical protein